MTTQAQAPTEEMRDRAHTLLDKAEHVVWSVRQKTVGPDLPTDVRRLLTDTIAQALAAQDALAVERERERCAKWHESMAVEAAKAEAGCLSVDDYSMAAVHRRNVNFHKDSAASLRAQGEK